MAKLNRAGRKHKRNEGTKETQPNYFNNIKRIIESSFNNNIIVEKIQLDVQGTARSTKVLVNEAIALAKKEGLNVAWSI